MSTPPLVSVEGLSRTYGDRLALDRVSFDVAPGELFALLGPNGGGKTTLFKLLATLIPPSEGTFRVDGSRPTAPCASFADASASSSSLRASTAS